MDIKVTTLDGAASGNVTLNDEIFGLEPRDDLIARMVRYQLAKRRSGNHAVKNRAEIHRTGAKMYKQKGTGRARHSSARSSVAAAAHSARSSATMPMSCRRRSARSPSSMRCRPS
jgi:ribosomal protein L4